MPELSMRPPPLPRRGGMMPGGPAMTGAAVLTVVILAAIVGVPAFIWFFCRIEPEAGQIAVLVRKTGKNLESGQILALEEGQKGIQLEVLSEGRTFKNPYTWGWELRPIVDIPAGELAVKTRLFGRDLPPGRIIADEGTKGIVAETLGPGKHRVNPYAYDVKRYSATLIRPGHVGVVVSLVGDDVINQAMPPEKRNTLLVAEGGKGVKPEVLGPGTYYLNPFMYNVVELNLQSQRFEMSGDDVISFLTMDGFAVTVEGTIEYAIGLEKAALLAHQVGDMDDILKKLILPRARGFSRIEGSKHPAINFIVGETRQKFQADLETHLHDKCDEWGVDIKSVLIRKIIVPDQIASISRDREVAVQDARKYAQQTEQAKSKAGLVQQEMLALQNKEKVEADTARIRAVIAARQDQAVRVVAAEKELDVARLENEAANFQAQAVLNKAAGDRDAIKARNEADAAVLAGQVEALGNGMNLARYSFYQTVAPKIESVLSTDARDGLGGLLLEYLPGAGEVKP